MKKFLSLFSVGTALMCALLSSSCTTMPPPIELSNMELENAADALYDKICQSGILDKIAAENEDDEEGELPVVEYDRMITNKWQNRGKTDPYVLVKRFCEKLQTGGHMTLMDDSRSGNDSGISKGIDELVAQNNRTFTEVTSSDVTSDRPESDYHVKGEIYDECKRLGDWQTVRHTIVIHLTKPTKKGTRTIWTEKIHIKKERKF